MKVKVASYNMRKAIGTDRRRNPERILQVLREIDADIIALQEADRRFGTRAAVLTAHLLEEHGDWQAVGVGGTARNERLPPKAFPFVRPDHLAERCQLILAQPP